MPHLLYPRERAPSTHWIGGWVSPRVIQDMEGKRKNSQLLPGIKPYNPIVQPVAQSLYQLSHHGSYTVNFLIPKSYACIKSLSFQRLDVSVYQNSSHITEKENS
jgi:hypothetical protein